MKTLEAGRPKPQEGESTGGMEPWSFTQPRLQPTPGKAFELGTQAQRMIDAQMPKGVSIRK